MRSPRQPATSRGVRGEGAAPRAQLSQLRVHNKQQNRAVEGHLRTLLFARLMALCQLTLMSRTSKLSQTNLPIQSVQTVSRVSNASK